MSSICRTCLSEVMGNPYIDINRHPFAKKQLALCIPELDCDLVLDPVICLKCAKALEAAHDFKTSCLRTEQRIHAYAQTATIGQNLTLDAVLGNNAIDLIEMHSISADATNDFNTVNDHFKTIQNLENHTYASEECFGTSDNYLGMASNATTGEWDDIKVNYDSIKKENIEIGEFEHVNCITSSSGISYSLQPKSEFDDRFNLESQEDERSSSVQDIDSREQLEGIKLESKERLNTAAMQWKYNDASESQEYNRNAEISNASSDIEECANLGVSGLIPEKSKRQYELVYKKFEDWCQQRKVNTVNQKVMLAYFDNMKTLKASTLWTTYSMLKTELKVKRNIHIQNYTTLIALLKRRSAGYHPKKSRILSMENIEKFLRHAEDKQYLFAKVATIIGIAGACSIAELTFLRVQDVVDEDSLFKITLSQTKTSAVREFVVTKGDISGVNLMNIIRKYINLRPQVTKHERFFINYRNEKCTVQPVGLNTFGKLPEKIARHLNLPHPAEYTGNCFRRSSASILGDSGADILKINHIGGWRSITVAEGYVENSFNINKKRIANDILGENSNICTKEVGVQKEICLSGGSNSSGIGVNFTN